MAASSIGFSSGTVNLELYWKGNRQLQGELNGWTISGFQLKLMNELTEILSFFDEEACDKIEERQLNFKVIYMDAHEIQDSSCISVRQPLANSVKINAIIHHRQFDLEHQGGQIRGQLRIIRKLLNVNIDPPEDPFPREGNYDIYISNTTNARETELKASIVEVKEYDSSIDSSESDSATEESEPKENI